MPKLPYSPAVHYAVPKHHMHASLVLLLLLAVAAGWELHTLHHPVHLNFCASGSHQPADEDAE